LNIDAQDIQDKDKHDEKLLHEKLTRSIIGCAFEVINELGSGFLESVYEKAMMIALTILLILYILYIDVNNPCK